MPPLRTGLLFPVLVLAIGSIAMAACDFFGEPELPDTTAASVRAYLDEVDYQESWKLWPGLREVRGRRAARDAPDHLPQPRRL